MSKHSEMSSSLRIIIVDDEPLARDNLRLALADIGGLEIVAECADGDAAIAAIRELRPHLVFLDIQMPGRDGFDVIQEIGVANMPEVVFVTAFDENALQAFEVQALDYLLKPIDDDRLREAVRRARDTIGGNAGAQTGQLTELLSDIRGGRSGGEPWLSRFMIREGERAIPLKVSEVDWIEADGNYVNLHTARDAYRLRVTLRTLAERLDPAHFARVHRSAIVNLDRVKEVQPWFGGDYVAILLSGKQVRVSRTHAQRVLRPLQ